MAFNELVNAAGDYTIASIGTPVTNKYVTTNDICATAAFIPEDILRLVFEDVLSTVKYRPWDEQLPRSFQVAALSHTACVLVSVCRHWRYVGLHAPRIWAAIHLRWPFNRHASDDEQQPPIAAEHAIAWADMHLERSLNTPLRISMMIYSPRAVQSAPMLISRFLTQAARIESLDIEVGGGKNDLASDMVLESLIVPFRGLRYLTLSCNQYGVDSVLAILANSPALETLKLAGTRADTVDTGVVIKPQVTLSCLHTLTLSELNTSCFVPGQLLLTPSLTTLIWHAPRFPHASSQLGAMITAATLCPQWRTLRLEKLYSDMQRGCVGTYIVPRLRELAQMTHLTIANSNVPDDVMEALGDRNAPLCPGLTHLVLLDNQYEYEGNMVSLQKRLQMQGARNAHLAYIAIDNHYKFDLLKNAAKEAGCELRLLTRRFRQR